MDIGQILKEFGFNLVAIVGGGLGTILSIVMNDKEVSFKSAIAQIVCGVALSGYGTEIVVKWKGLDEHNAMIGLTGFILGLVGMSIAKGIIKWGKKLENNPFKVLKKGGENDNADS